MTDVSRFERDLAAALADATDNVVKPFDPGDVARLARTSGRARRTLFDRWRPLPLFRRTTLLPAPRTAWLLVILALLVAAAIVAVGSQRRVAPPFGLARNGVIAYAADGDLYARDPATGEVTNVVVTREYDVSPIFSRDGTKLAFIRLSEGGEPPEELMVANVDGSDVRRLVGPEAGLDWWDWSPNGKVIAFISFVGGARTLSVVGVEGDRVRRTIELPFSPEYVLWRPPDGSELIFRGVEPGSDRNGIYASRPDGTGLRPITSSDRDSRSHLGLYAASHDGRLLAYTSFDEADTLRIHLVDLDTREDRTLIGPTHEGYAVFSPDGARLAFTRYSDERAGMTTAQAFVAKVDRADAVSVGPGVRIPTGRQALYYDFAPDGTKVFVTHREESQTWLVDVTGGPGEDVPWTSGDLPGWQRRP